MLRTGLLPVRLTLASRQLPGNASCCQLSASPVLNQQSKLEILPQTSKDHSAAMAILLDDLPAKAAHQPYNHLCVHTGMLRHRPGCAPTCAGSHHTHSIAIVFTVIVITISTTTRWQQRDAQAQAQMGERAATIIIIICSSHNCQ